MADKIQILQFWKAYFLRRHETKPNKADFGEQDMRRWWKEDDLIHIIPEKILTKNLSVSDTVDMIYNLVS